MTPNHQPCFLGEISQNAIPSKYIELEILLDVF